MDCQRWRFHVGIYAKFDLTWLALGVHSVGVLMICLQSVVAGLLLLVAVLSQLAFSFVYL